MNKKILFPAIIIVIILLSVAVYFWLQRTIMPIPPSGTTTPTSTQPVTEIKNPNVTNAKRDFSGLNDGESVSFAWSPVTKGVFEYVLFVSESPSGLFTEVGRSSANRSPNAVHNTPDARIKDLCYKLEARDRNGNIVREYEPICIPKFKE